MFPHHYEYLHGVAILKEDAVEADLSDCTKSNSGHFLGHGHNLVKVYVR
jgi:hypothetical protein